jgi:hypothetical protein
MSQDSILINFPGLLVVDQTSGRGRVSYLRTITRVELNTRGASPTAAVTIKLRVDDVANAQEFTLTAGLTYREINASGSGISVAADSFLDAIVTAAGDGADLDVRVHYTAAEDLGIASTEDLGLGTLLDLKRQLLTAGIITETTYDVLIASIGRGVAGLIDRHCNRILARAVGTTDVFSAATDHWIARRYPLEAVTTLEVRTDLTSGWAAQTDAAQNWDAESGWVDFGGVLGDYRSRARLTYSGGYWYDTTVDASGSLPAGATLLPAAIKEAWYRQCAHVWSKLNSLGLDHAVEPEQRTTLTNMDLIPLVKLMLDPYRRMAIL